MLLSKSIFVTENFYNFLLEENYPVKKENYFYTNNVDKIICIKDNDNKNKYSFIECFDMVKIGKYQYFYKMFIDVSNRKITAQYRINPKELKTIFKLSINSNDKENKLLAIISSNNINTFLSILTELDVENKIKEYKSFNKYYFFLLKSNLNTSLTLEKGTVINIDNLIDFYRYAKINNINNYKEQLLNKKIFLNTILNTSQELIRNELIVKDTNKKTKSISFRKFLILNGIVK